MIGGVFVGVVEGVRPKGVEVCACSRISKFERLDDGLVSGTDGGPEILGGIAVRLVVGSGLRGGLLIKRPAPSLMNPWFFVVLLASVT